MAVSSENPPGSKSEADLSGEWRAFRACMRTLAAESGLDLSETQIGQLDVYARLLVETNRSFNLTRIVEPEDIASLHVLDATLVWQRLDAEIGELSTGGRQLSLADLGSGAGLPGLPLKVIAPQVALTLVDGTQKRVAFLRNVTAAMELRDVKCVHGRAEELGRRPAFRERYDVVAARGLAKLPTLLEYALPWLRPGGLLLAYKGPGFPEELHESSRALRLLKAEVERVIPIFLPRREVTRLVAVIRKVGRTPREYPRAQGMPRRSPL